MEVVIFWIFSAIAVASALLCVTRRNPVASALWLVLTMFALAGIFVLLEAHFIAAMQVLVYAGAIMVLFLFVIMLLNLGGETPSPTQPWIRPTAWAVAGLTIAAVAVTLTQNPGPALDAAAIAAVFQGSGVEQVADQLFGPFLLSFHLVGVLLLTGIIAAVGLVQQRATETAKVRAAAGQAGRTQPEPPPMPNLTEEAS